MPLRRCQRRTLFVERLEDRRCLTAELVADVETAQFDDTSSFNSHVAKVGDVLFFMASTPEHGRELWRTDGTPTGTNLVKDITPGPTDSGFNTSAEGNGQVFVSIDSDLWVINATTLDASSIRLPSKVVRPMIVLNGVLYFSATRNDTGAELWRSDGTEAGTFLLKDIVPGNGASFPRNLTIVGETIFFSASDNSINGITRESLWKSDGTETGTVRVKSFDSAGQFLVDHFASYDGNLYFEAFGELWRSDGSEAGTNLFADIYPGEFQSFPSSFTEFNGELYFEAFKPQTDSALFKTDGITVTQLTSPTMLGPFNISEFVISAGNLYMNGTSNGGAELWKTDGTVLSLVSEASGSEEYYVLRDLVDVDGILFFTAEDNSKGRELWRSDGTSPGTRIVADILPGKRSSNPGILVELNHKLVFAATDKTYGTELWVSSGDIGSTQILKDTWPGVHASIRTRSVKFAEPVVLNDQIYFTGQVNRTGINSNCSEMHAIWTSDGTSEGTSYLDRNPVACDLFVFGNKILFMGMDYQVDVELWASDGTAGGSQLLKNINQQPLGPGRTNASFPADFIELAGQVYFVADNGLNGRELWRTDGTAEGTQLAVDVLPGSAGSNPKNLTVHNGSLFFSATTEIGEELWISDGTSAGTRTLKDIHDGVSSSSPHSFLSAQDNLYFVASNGETGDELWVTDGTEANTQLVSDLSPGSASSSPSSLVNVGDNMVFFIANDGTNGNQVWVTTGSAAETLAVTSTLKFAKIAWLTSYAGKAIFLVDPNQFGENQVWTSDGSPSGTKIIAEFMGGYTSFFNVNDRPKLETSQGVYFAALSKPQLWKTDGTAEGTLLVDAFGTYPEDPFHTQRLASPRLLATTNCEIYLQATDSVHGGELWKLSKLRVESIRLLGFVEGEPDRFTFRVKLSQPLDGLGTGQFETSNANATVDSVTQVDESTYDVVVTGSNLIGSDVVLGLRLKDTEQFENSMGCQLSSQSPAINEHYALPVALDDVVTTTKGRSRDITVKLNDHHPAGDLNGLTIELLDTPPTNIASVSVTSLYTITVRPASNFVYGSFTFRYRLIDATLGASLPATVTVGVSKTHKQNPWSLFDVNDSGLTTATDALLVINLLNDSSSTRNVVEMPLGMPYFDVNGDELITPTDALLIINELNSRSSGEAEFVSLPLSKLNRASQWDDWLEELSLNRRLRKSISG